MKFCTTPADCKSPKTPKSDKSSNKPSFITDQFTFETQLKEFAMTEGPNPNHLSHGHSNPYLEITANSGSTNGNVPNGHVINTRQMNGYHNPNAMPLNRSLSEFTAGATTDHQCVTKCTLYTLKFLSVISILVAACSIVIMTKLWTKCNELETRLSTAEVSYTAGLADPNMCMPCDDLVQGPFDEDNEQLNTLIQTQDNGTMKCCAKTSAQISTLFNLFVKRKLQEKCNLELLNVTDTPNSGCKVNTTASPGAPPPSSLRPSAHLQIDPKKKQTPSSEEDPIRHWTEEGKVTHLDGVVLIDDRLQIPETGTYFLYSQVGFLVFYDNGMNEQNIDLANQALFHKVYRYNPIYPNKGSQELLRSEVTQCWEQHKAYGRYTSYVGAALRLNRGDQIYVKVSRLSALSPEDALTYFGLFKIHS